MNLQQMKALFVSAGANKLFAKSLAENDNSKNQVYFGPGLNALQLFPVEDVIPVSDLKDPIFKAKLAFGWLTDGGQVAPAPGAQLILYPQYPEVRFSGFLRGCKAAPSELMAGRKTGRVLFLGITEARRVVGFVVGAGSEIVSEFESLGLPVSNGVFIELSLPSIPGFSESRNKLLSELRRINRLDWINSKQLGSDGISKPCNSTQCGGYTLEAELLIPKNSDSEPDFMGWEVKQHSVTDFDKTETSSPITLMTPEPDGGYYGEQKVEAFLRKFGYPDKNGKPDRINFGGRHYVSKPCAVSGMTMELDGYDAEARCITNPSGCIALVNTSSGEVAASWSFGKILKHWSRKHANAAYVPSNCREEPQRQYRYGHKIRLAQKTDALLLLNAMAEGVMFYDPGIKLVDASSAKPTHKARSQFRVPSKKISALYESIETVVV